LLLLPLLASVPALLAPLGAAVRPAAGRALRDSAQTLTRLPRRFFAYAEAHPGALVRRLSVLEAPLHPLLELHARLHRRFHFRPIERGLTAFLVTRTLFAGAGAVSFDGGPLLRLAQRPPHLRALSRIFTSGDERPLYESRDLFFRPWSAFAARRRLHLLLGDANLCDWAQVLRIGSTALVLEAIEADPDGDWPRLADPLAALRELNRDPELRGELALVCGGRRSALALQLDYIARVRAILARAAEPPADWKVRVLAMWQESLDALERDPEALADRVDWLAKRALLRRDLRESADVEALEARGAELLEATSSPDAETRRLRGLAYRVLRTDLRYHELGPAGGHRRLREQGRIRRLVSDAEVARARREPPGDTRARGRGRAIREAVSGALGGAATWHRVRVGRFDWRWLPDPLEPAARRLSSPRVVESA
jgi:proteasome accessory factor A